MAIFPSPPTKSDQLVSRICACPSRSWRNHERQQPKQGAGASQCSSQAIPVRYSKAADCDEQLRFRDTRHKFTLFRMAASWTLRQRTSHETVDGPLSAAADAEAPVRNDIALWDHTENVQLAIARRTGLPSAARRHHERSLPVLLDFALSHCIFSYFPQIKRWTSCFSTAISLSRHHQTTFAGIER